ncbi:UDP-2,4-diacetamido-2,4,6-trideoxy-beta-L-altropyranose hydrolase [Candidatus Pelagibacter sp.]|uniref:UDP-2,4-diacetamido-2,4, 6-trideoxy-beta-L-altropyranose hydrolase n=1 Tax=Candidatus Pelagibacter sp. TaxID=2024849 RepID=UPI003F84B6B5
MKVIFRVDSSSIIGIGHLARCLKLAKVLNKCKIYFVTKNLTGNANFLIKKKYKTYFINSNNEDDDAKEFIKILKNQIKVTKNQAYVVMDNYNLKQKWEKKVKPFTKKLLTIDDRIRSSSADYYLNNNWFFDQNVKFLKLSNQGLLLGPIYGLVNKNKTNKKKIFVTIYFGSNDKYNLTTQTLKNLIRFKIKNIYVILGHNFNFYKDLKKIDLKKNNIKIISKFKNLNEIFSETRLFIGAGGSISTERLLHKIPSLICPVVNNQKFISKTLHKENFQHNLNQKFFFDYGKWKKAFKHLIKKEIFFIKNLNYLSFKDSILRVKNIFYEKKHNFKIVKFNKKHKNILYNFINQPDAIKSRLTQKYIGIEEHEKFISNIEKSNNENLYIGLNKKVVSGFIRFSHSGNKFVFIDIYTCPTLQGFSFAKMMLFEGIKNTLRTKKNIIFLAKVKKNNFKSINFFKKYFKKKQEINNIYVFEYKMKLHD